MQFEGGYRYPSGKLCVGLLTIGLILAVLHLQSMGATLSSSLVFLLGFEGTVLIASAFTPAGLLPPGKGYRASLLWLIGIPRQGAVPVTFSQPMFYGGLLCVIAAISIDAFSLPQPERTASSDPEQAAIGLSRESTEIANMYVDKAIQGLLKQATGHLRTIGWSAEKIEEGKYLTQYTYETADRRGFFFEVHLESSLVRNVAQSRDLMAEYGLVPVHTNWDSVDAEQKQLVPLQRHSWQKEPGLNAWP